MAKHEYKTTHGALYQAHACDRYLCGDNCKQPDQEPDDPIQPDGRGWELVNTSASRARLYWTWRRAPEEVPMTSTRLFPVLWQGDRARKAALEAAGCPRYIPWAFIARYEDGCLWNHDQTVQRLSERGGLAPEEILAVIASTEKGGTTYEILHQLWVTTPEETTKKLLALLALYDLSFATTSV